MWADTMLLMRHYWKLDQREYSRLRGWKLLGYIAATIAFLFIGVFSAALGYGASFLLQPDMPVRVGPGVFPGLLLTFVLLGVLITGLNQAVRALFLSGDLERLVVAPVRTRSIMVAKLLSRLPGNVSLLLVIAVPALVAYGIGAGAGVVYYVLGLILLLLAPLFGLGVGALLALVLVRLMPPNRLNEMLAASYALFGILFALIAQLPRLFFANEETSMQTLETAGELLGRVEGLPLPTMMAGRGLMALDAGQLDGLGLLGILFYLLVTVGLFMGVVMFGDRFYLSGWLKAQSAGGKRRGLEADGGAFSGRSLAVSLGLKDWLLRIRDPRQLVSLLGGGIIAIVVTALAIFNDNGGAGSLMDASSTGVLQAPGNWAALTAAFQPGVIMGAWAMFAGYVILSTPAMSALAIEGRSFPLLKAAPLRPREVWMAKLWSVLVPGLVVFALFLLLTRLMFAYSLSWLPYALLTGGLLSAGLTMINVSAGFRFANLDWDDPRRMTTGGGGWVSLIFTLIYGIPATIITVAPFAAAQIWPQWSLPLMLAGVLLLALLTWVLMKFMAGWAEKSWELLPA